jgi:hypothetical protein
MTNNTAKRYKIEDFFKTEELQQRPVRDGNRIGNQVRKIVKDKHGMVIEIGEWDGPYVWMEFPI